jgi:hypothetical protein
MNEQSPSTTKFSAPSRKMSFPERVSAIKQRARMGPSVLERGDCVSNTIPGLMSNSFPSRHLFFLHNLPDLFPFGFMKAADQ